MAHTNKDGANPTPPAELCHADADDVTRHSFRGQVTEADHITAAIADQHHAVVDIGSHGIGILLAEGAALVPGQRHELTLTVEGQTLALQGLVRHVTRDDEANAFLCGIQLLDLDPVTEQRLQAFVSRQRRTLPKATRANHE